MKILLIEDDDSVRTYIKKGLQELNHVVEVAENGKSGLFFATTQDYDVIITDLMLPELGGMTLIKTLRGAGNKTPVLILSARNDVEDRVEGLQSGGDDYLVKPFAFIELVARIEALVRRKPPANSSEDHILIAGDIKLNLLSRTVTRAAVRIDLQAREFRLLAYLLQNKGQLITRTMLLESVWDYHFEPQTNVIDVHISRLRKKIGDKENQIIKTIRGSGYIIDASV